MIQQVGRHTVEQWYDRQTRLWVTQVKDERGCQVGDAEFAGAGNLEGRKVDFKAAVEKAVQLDAKPPVEMPDAPLRITTGTGKVITITMK
jgi:hypothetical protein